MNNINVKTKGSLVETFCASAHKREYYMKKKTYVKNKSNDTTLDENFCFFILFMGKRKNNGGFFVIRGEGQKSEFV